MLISESIIRSIIRKQLIKEASEEELRTIAASEIPGGRFEEVDAEEPMSFFVFPNAFSGRKPKRRRVFS